MPFYVLHQSWYMQKTFNILATSRSFGNIRCFDQNYQPGKITLQVSALIIKYLVALFFG